MDIIQFMEVLGNAGEFIGAIAVVITLIYLAHEVKESRQATESDTQQRLQEGFTSVNALPAKDPQMARLVRLIFNNQLHDLDEDELSQINAIYQLWMNQYIKAAQAHRTGVINDNQLTLYANDANYWFNTEIGQVLTKKNYDLALLVEYLRPYTKSNEEMQKISARPEDWL